MEILSKLQSEMKNVEAESDHNGYWYSISDTLIILINGLLCGLQRIDDIHDWAKAKPTREFLETQFKIKRIFSRAQFYNILRCVNAETFKHAFTRWMKSWLSGGISGKTVAIDGKTICGTDKLTKDGSVLHIASALVSELNLVIGSHECGTKTGEITAFRELIAMLDVSGAVVVADALHCNKKSAEAVVEANADYLFVIKDNVPTMKADIELYIQNEAVPSHTTVEKNGGRIEKRTAYSTDQIAWLDGKENWKNISSIGAIHRVFEKNGVKSNEWHYYISSAPLTPKELLFHARLEWSVESMHWLLDVHYAEDKTRVWDMNVQKILNTAKKAALNMVRLFKSVNRNARTPLTSVMKENLFDLQQFAAFLDFFRDQGKLT